MKYCFGEFELDIATYALTRQGQRVRLRPKLFDLLHYLVVNCGRLVTKQELLDAVWGGTHVDEAAIPWNISHARRALGQRSGDQQPIETVHGRGYRFTARVTIADGDSTQPLADGNPVSETATLPHAEDHPFVGRHAAMQSLVAWLRTAKVGRGMLALLVGDPGIGKTRCLDELGELASAQGFTVWTGRSVEDAWAPVFWPWLQILRSIAHDRPSLRSECDTLLAQLGLFDETTNAASDPAANSFGLFDGLSRLLSAAARAAPVLLLLDDLQWADAGTVDLLTFIAPELKNAQILAIGTQRTGRAAYRTRELRRLSRHAERLELGPLTPDDVGHYLGFGARENPELCHAVQRASAGNPLFLKHTVRSLIEQHGRAALASLSPRVIQPTTSTRDVLRSELDSFDAGARRVLALASILGEVFELATLQALSELPNLALLAALEAAHVDGFIVVEAPTVFRFQHALLRSTLYDDLSPADRLLGHRRAADVLVQSEHLQPRYGEIAHHYYASLALGDLERVVAAAQRAARAAARLQAFADAAVFCQWALEAQAADPHTKPRARAELLLMAAQLEQQAGHGDDALKLLAELSALALQHAYGDLLVQGALVVRPSHVMGSVADGSVCAMLEAALKIAPEGANALRIKALSQLSWVPPYALDMARSKELSATALALARELAEEEPLIAALHARLYALSGPDDIDALLAVSDELLERDRTPRTWVSVEAFSARYSALLHRGDLPAADRALAALGQVASERAWPGVIWSHDRLLAQRAFMRGDLATADTTFSELRERGRRLRLSYCSEVTGIMRAVLTIERDGPQAFAKGWDGAALWNQLHEILPSLRPSVARLAAELGHTESAKAVLVRMSADDFAQLPQEIGYLNALANLALLAIRVQDRERAALLYDMLAPYSQHNTPNCLMFYEGSVSHYLALLAAFLQRPQQARRHFEDALAMNERLDQRLQLAKTCYEYARWLFAGEIKSAARLARQLKARAIESADAMSMTWLADQARALETRH